MTIPSFLRPTSAVIAYLVMLASHLILVEAACGQDTRPPLKIQIFSSVVGQADVNRAKAATQPLINRLAGPDFLAYPIQLDFFRGRNISDLKEFGRRLNNGEIHMGVVWGIELGWLREDFPDLRAVAITLRGDGNINHYSQLLVRIDREIKDVSDIREPFTLASYRNSALGTEIFLRELQQENRNLRVDPETRPTTMVAIRDVLSGAVDGVVVDVNAFERYQVLQPIRAKRLKSIRTSQPLPTSALIGNQRQVDRLAPDERLWTRMQNSLATIAATAEGRQLTSFWRFSEFVKPTIEYHNFAARAAREHPSSLLEDVR